MTDDVVLASLEKNRASQILPKGSGLLSRSRVRGLIGTLVRNNRLQTWEGRPLINLGCGGNLLRDFINLDYGWSPGVDVCWDVRRGLPFKTISAEGVFCEHTLEHFEWQDALSLLLEIKRVLVPGGTVRISVPDAELVIDQYNASRIAGECSIEWPNRWPIEGRLNLTPMGKVNNSFRRIYEPYEMGHKFLYDYQTLKHFLELTGFTDIERVSYLRGRDQRLLVDYKKREPESLYIEASTPVGGD